MAIVTKVVHEEFPPPITQVTLVLTGDEAKAVLAVLRAVGGSPFTSRRRLAAQVEDALTEAGVPVEESDLTGSVIFEDSK